MNSFINKKGNLNQLGVFKNNSSLSFSSTKKRQTSYNNVLDRPKKIIDH